MAIMTEHVLISKATRRPYGQIPKMPEGARYDIQRGQWMMGNVPMISTADGPALPETKKCDQETGEDQKGE